MPYWTNNYYNPYMIPFQNTYYRPFRNLDDGNTQRAVPEFRQNTPPPAQFGPQQGTMPPQVGKGLAFTPVKESPFTQVAQMGAQPQSKLEFMQGLPLNQLLAGLPQYMASFGGNKGPFFDWMMQQKAIMASLATNPMLYGQVLASLGAQPGMKQQLQQGVFPGYEPPTEEPTLPSQMLTNMLGGGPTQRPQQRQNTLQRQYPNGRGWF
jgi:hypothetical protein